MSNSTVWLIKNVNDALKLQARFIPDVLRKIMNHETRSVVQMTQEPSVGDKS